MVLGWRAVSYERGTPVARLRTALGSGLVRLEESLSTERVSQMRIQLASTAQVSTVTYVDRLKGEAIFFKMVNTTAPRQEDADFGFRIC